MAVYLHITQEPLLMYREQQQIFLWDGDYVAALLQQTGGFATLAAQFLVQFFYLPWAGAITTAVITTLTGIILWLTVRRLNDNSIFWALAMLPAYLQGIYLLDMGFHYEGVIAMLCCSLLLYLYVLVKERSILYVSLAVGAVFTLLLFVFVGSIATLFAIGALTYGLLRHPRKGWTSSLFLIVCLIAALFFVSNGKVVGFDYALWTKGYYEYHIEQGWWQALAWIAVPVIMIISKLTVRCELKPVWEVAGVSLLLVAGGWFIFVQSEKRINKDFRTMAELQRCVNQEDWDGIINNRNINYQNYLHLNFLNLALSHQGRLMTDLFRYPQKGAQSLMVAYQAYNDLNVLFSHIYYHTGIISEALCLSFGTMIATTHGNPSLLKLLVKERLIYGDYQVAEKYISRLEKTYAYNNWATDMRRFLFNDEAVANDPELGAKRKSLPDMQPSFVILDGIMADLIKVIDTDTEENHAFEYAMTMMMLEKNMQGVKYLIEMTGGRPLSELMQQAVTVYAEHDEEYCRSHGVSDETISRFMSFKQAVLNARRNNMNQQTALASYRGTFWYYYMFE
jgi:hypothetical protein